MNFKKYIWKCRLLVLNTPNYTNEVVPPNKGQPPYLLLLMRGCD